MPKRESVARSISEAEAKVKPTVEVSNKFAGKSSEDLSSMIASLREQVGEAEKSKDESAVLALENEIREAENALRGGGKAEARVIEEPDTGPIFENRAVELRKQIALAEKSNDEAAVLALENQLRAVELRKNIHDTREAIDQAEKQKNEGEALRLESQIRSLEDELADHESKMIDGAKKEAQTEAVVKAPETAVSAEMEQGKKNQERAVDLRNKIAETTFLSEKARQSGNDAMADSYEGMLWNQEMELAKLEQIISVKKGAEAENKARQETATEILKIERVKEEEEVAEEPVVEKIEEAKVDKAKADIARDFGYGGIDDYEEVENLLNDAKNEVIMNSMDTNLEFDEQLSRGQELLKSLGIDFNAEQLAIARAKDQKSFMTRLTSLFKKTPYKKMMKALNKAVTLTKPQKPRY